MVPMAESTLRDVASAGEDLEKKVASFGDYIKTTAEGLYPAFSDQIRSGIPTANLLEPYRQLGKQMLGDQFEPDFLNDHRVSAVMHGNMDPKTGRSTPMTMDQWRQHIMQTPDFGWGYTAEAHRRVNSILQTLHKGLMGK
jgi:hypothetical protein